MYLASLIGITTVLVIFVMTSTQVAASIGLDSGSESNQVGQATAHDSKGNWQKVLLGDEKKCKGLVFESLEDAEAAAIEQGCSGYHEHPKDDGTVVYMPCALEDVDIEDVKVVAKPILRHRIVKNYKAEAEGMSVDQIIESLL